MNIYFAPMEGITGYVYRNVHHRFFGGIEEYYTPFLVPNQTRRLTSREMNDILPEHNQGVLVVPQILTNKADDFVWAAEKIKALGYDRVNLNLGCPSGTVFSKRRGAGLLAYPEELDWFLEDITDALQKLEMKLSVKTRIGVEDPEEFHTLLRIYNRYPLERLIIHPRVRTDYYRNHPNLEMFRTAEEESINPVCYNGDLFSVEAAAAFGSAFPKVDSVMLGRGMLTDPALAEKITAAGQRTECRENRQMKRQAEKQRLKQFHDTLLAGYREVIPGDKNVLFKMKELWYYLAYAFEDGERLVKRIRKAAKMAEYTAAVDQLFAEKELSDSPAFPGTP